MRRLLGNVGKEAVKTVKHKQLPRRPRHGIVFLGALGAVLLFFFVVFSGQFGLPPPEADAGDKRAPTPSVTAAVGETVKGSNATLPAVDEVYVYPPAARGAEGVIVPLMSVASATDGGITFPPNDSLRDDDRVASHHLPSWPLHVVAAECDGCTDRDAHAVTLASAGLRTLPDPEKQAVLATTLAPLGLVGPMLLAMASVTDDVDSAAELPLWRWVRHGFGSAAAASAPVSPHLAVLATPSTDQTYRVLLREAQRQTWRTYSEVARRETDFVGALLPLYLFAGGDERALEVTAAYRASIEHVVLGNGSATDLTSLLPTVAEVKAAEACQGKGAAAAGCSVAQRRLQLRATWSSEALPESPCSHVTTVTQEAGHAWGFSQLANISSQLSLPVVPAFTSPARFICHASSALWLEALEHRDSLWLDMYSDYSPSTKKPFGLEGGHGDRVEVGMSQKGMLWLNYAYYQFPDVAYILKGDDDSYVKVPQFLSNLRWLRGDRDRSAHVKSSTAVRSQEWVSKHSDLYSGVKGECLYMGLQYGDFRDGFYKTGMLYVVDRRIVRGLLERPRLLAKDVPPAKDRTIAHVNMLRLLTFPYSEEYNDLYRVAALTQEDKSVGIMIWQLRDRIYALCPGNYVRHVRESGKVFYDLRYRNGHLRWSGVVMHRCFPPDFVYIHRYVQTENEVARRLAQAPSDFNETMAEAELVGWAAAHTNHSLPRYGEWVRAHFERNVNTLCNSTYSDVDNTTIYHMEYREERGHWTMPHAYLSVPLEDGGSCR